MTSQDQGSGIDDIIRGVQRGQVARGFVELSLADAFGGGPTSVGALASVTGVDPSMLSRLLRAADAMGLCAQTGDAHQLTPVGEQLHADSPGNASGWLMLMTAPWVVRPWGHLAGALRSGRASFPEIHGQEFWEYVADHPDVAGMFDAAMTSGAVSRADDLCAALDWSSVGLVVDVGGSQGLLVATLLSRIEHLRGVVADRGEVVASPASAVLELGSRIQLTSADFFVEVPAGGDVYVLSRILHDWADSEAIEILRCCRAAMGPDTRLCLLEQIAPESSDLSMDEMFDLAVKDLNMLVLVGGRERTLPEYVTLLDAADLEFAAVHRGPSCDVIEARPTSGG